jgi:hypothetical protein
MRDQHAPQLADSVIPWWQDGQTTSETVKEPVFLSRGVHTFLVQARNWLLFPLQQMDALTCSESVLTLLAWDRDIRRFDGEPLALFRNRVKYAALNAQDAGSVAGFQRIFARLGLGIVAFKEREKADEWDVCTIELTDSDLSRDSKLVQILIEQYGRTCRRYRFQVSYPAVLALAGGEFSHRFSQFVADSDNAANLYTRPRPFEHQQQVFIATIGHSDE